MLTIMYAKGDHEDPAPHCAHLLLQYEKGRHGATFYNWGRTREEARDCVLEQLESFVKTATKDLEEERCKNKTPH